MTWPTHDKYNMIWKNRSTQNTIVHSSCSTSTLFFLKKRNILILMWLRNKHRYILGPEGLLGCSNCKSQITVFGNFRLQKHILSSLTDVAAQYNVSFISAMSCLVTFSISVSFFLSLTLYTFLCFHTFHCLHMRCLLEV